MPYALVFLPLISSIICYFGKSLGNLFSQSAYLGKERYYGKRTVKWFNTNKGYGFIEPDDGGKDVFIHISAVEKSGLKTLLENQKITFEINQDKGRSSAANIKIVS